MGTPVQVHEKGSGTAPVERFRVSAIAIESQIGLFQSH